MGILFTILIASKNKKKNTVVKRGFFWIRIVMTSNYLTDWYPEKNNLEDCCGEQPLRAGRWKLRFHTWFFYTLLSRRVWRLWPKEALLMDAPIGLSISRSTKFWWESPFESNVHSFMVISEQITPLLKVLDSVWCGTKALVLETLKSQ